MPKRTSLVQRGLLHAPYFAAWWVLSMLLWLLFTSTVAPSDAIVGMCASLITAAAGEMVRTRSSIEFRGRMPGTGASSIAGAGRPRCPGG
ncbi:MAG: hypothetical protein M3Q23_18495 [Actinomycetota bacterium]|nr:hypothetical protein [Actinomycetota bacterium]